MGRMRTIGRRSFLIGSAAVLGGENLFVTHSLEAEIPGQELERTLAVVRV